MTLTHNPDPDAEWGHDPHVIALCRGDSWTAVSQNLPPIYAVRFGKWRAVFPDDPGTRGLEPPLMTRA